MYIYIYILTRVLSLANNISIVCINNNKLVLLKLEKIKLKRLLNTKIVQTIINYPTQLIISGI